jgi:beta-galactosidase
VTDSLTLLEQEFVRRHAKHCRKTSRSAGRSPAAEVNLSSTSTDRPIGAPFPFLLYGGDYNPEQWPEEIWQDDVRLMREAHINVVTLGVFAWVSLEPAEGVYTFEWMDRVMDLLHANGIRVCLATGTAAQPAWLSRKYPEILPVGRNGIRRKHGQRQNVCPNSPIFRAKSTALAWELARRYGKHPALLLWHISNEYGTHCYCDVCVATFRRWLQARYESLDAVNEAWYTRFWGHTFTDWAEIETPTDNGERSMQGLLLDYDRFQNDSILACYLAERAVLRDETPSIPITTNLMGTFKPLDYHTWGPVMDIVSWDSYPGKHTPPASTALRHDLMRGLRDGQSFLLMEQTPSQVNWMKHCVVKRPGELRLQSYQAIARGSDSAMYFQWRKGRGAFEKFHGAIVGHEGRSDTRVFREVAHLGKELQRFGAELNGARVQAQAAIVFDWQNWWALEYSAGPSVDLKYLPQIEKYHAAFHARNIPVDVISPEADFSVYKILVAPALYLLRPGVAARIASFVAHGGTFLTTFFSGIVDENDLVTLGGYPAELRRVLGIRVEEIDALYPEERNTIVFDEEFGVLHGEYPCGLCCERLHFEGATALALFGQDFYRWEPALTRHAFGDGFAYYVATDPEPALVRGLVTELCREQGVTPSWPDIPSGVEVIERINAAGTVFTFVLNHGSASVLVPLPGGRGFQDALSGKPVPAFTARLEPYGVIVLRSGGS